MIGMLTPNSIRRKVRPLIARAKATIAEIQRKRAQARTARAAAKAQKELIAKMEAKEKLIFKPAVLDYVEEERGCEAIEHKAQRAEKIIPTISHVSVVVFTKNAGAPFSALLNACPMHQLWGLPH